MRSAALSRLSWVSGEQDIWMRATRLVVESLRALLFMMVWFSLSGLAVVGWWVFIGVRLMLAWVLAEGVIVCRFDQESGSRVARMPTHAMRLHEWGTRSCVAASFGRRRAGRCGLRARCG